MKLIERYLEVSPFVWAASYLVWTAVFVKMAVTGVYEAHFYANLLHEFWPELALMVAFTPAVFIHLFKIAKERRINETKNVVSADTV